MIKAYDGQRVGAKAARVSKVRPAGNTPASLAAELRRKSTYSRNTSPDASKSRTSVCNFCTSSPGHSGYAPANPAKTP